MLFTTVPVASKRPTKGSIFLDEIGELDMVSQVKLLRVLQDQTFEPLGDSRQKQVDTRIISATNRNLQEMVRDGSFREDLFYRINLITIRMPALRERPDDIPLLVDHFVGLQRELNGIRAVEVSAEAIDYLQKLPYPGNIRELKNLVDRTILVSDKNVLTDRDFKPILRNIVRNGRVRFGAFAGGNRKKHDPQSRRTIREQPHQNRDGAGTKPAGALPPAGKIRHPSAGISPSP